MMKANVRAEIERWGQAALSRPIVRFSAAELHIDEIDQVFSDQDNWIHGALQCLEIARETRDSLSPHDIVCAVFHLEDMPARRGAAPTGLSSMAAEFYIIPPELVWLRGDQCSEYMSILTKGVDLTSWEVPLDNVQVVYYEYASSSPEPVEYTRTVWIVCHGKGHDRLFSE